MIRRIRVQNFLSLKDTAIDLSPLTIFIGPNASGKSAIFKALVTLSKLLHQFPVRGPLGEFTLEPAVTLDYLVWRGNAGLPIIFQVWFPEDSDDEAGYTLELRKGTAGWSVARERVRLGDGWLDSAEKAFQFPTERRGLQEFLAPYRATLSHLVWPYRNDQAALSNIAPFLELAQRVGEIWRYRPSANDIASFAQPAKEEDGKRVRENGWGLSLELQRLQGAQRSLFQTIEEELQRLFPHIRFIGFETERFGVRLAFTTDRSEDLVPAPQESDGVLLTTFLLWRVHTAAPNMRLCLEEPESGVHPYLLDQRCELLKRFAYGAASRPPVQLLVATHSADFISALEVRAQALDIIRVVEFDHDQGTMVRRLSDFAQIDTLLDAFGGNPGELWWSGAIGAVPSLQEPGRVR
jgi:predicted ATPase